MYSYTKSVSFKVEKLQGISQIAETIKQKQEERTTTQEAEWLKFGLSDDKAW